MKLVSMNQTKLLKVQHMTRTGMNQTKLLKVYRMKLVSVD